MPNQSDQPIDTWVLVISANGQAPRTVPIQLGLVFGRSSRSSCVLDDPTVSGTHARIVERDGVLAIEDLGSENGTQIPGGPTLSNGQTHPLQPGVSMRFGETLVAVQTDGADEDGTASVDDVDATLINAGPVQAAAPAPAPVPVPAPANPTPIAQPTPQQPSSHPSVPASKFVSHGDSSSYAGTIDFGPGEMDDTNAKISAQANLRASRARLVIASQVDRRVDPIEDIEFEIGRGKASRCRITHPAISTPHASIRFDIREKRFLLEDQNSKNHTYLNGRLVPHGSGYELTTESHLRFGPVDALFIVEIDADGIKASPERQRLAAKVLADAQAITVAQKMAVIEDNKSLGKHIGEALLLAPDPITVKQWIDAMEQARYLEIRSGFERNFNPRLVALGVVIVLIIIALFVLL